MRVRLSWQKRAIILLAGSLIVLSIILAVFAIREAEREKLLKDRETSEEQRRIISTVTVRAKSALHELEQRVDGFLNLSGNGAPSEIFSTAFLEVIEKEELISEFFILDDAGNIVLPGGGFLYSLPNGGPAAKEVLTGIEMNDLWRQAETVEYQIKNYQEAAGLYQKLMLKISDKGLKALLLSRIGRCYGKAGNYRQAVEAYQILLETASPDLTSEGIPLSVISHYQIISLYLEAGKKSEAAGALLDFRKNLFASVWPLSKSRFEYYRKYSDDLFESISNESVDENAENAIVMKWNRMKSQEGLKLQRMRTLEAFAQQVVPQIEIQRGIARRNQDGFWHLSVLTELGPLLVAVKNSEIEDTYALLLNSEAMGRRLFPSDSTDIDLPEGWVIQIVDESGRPLAGFELTSPLPSGLSRVVSRGFDGNFPPWIINLYQSSRDMAQKRFQLKRAIYIFSVIIVITALFSGGYLAIRSTAKELQLAQLRSDFVSTVSHEFRTPLTSIRYLAELLRRDRIREEKKRHQYYETIAGESERLSRLIENLLDFSKIESGMKEYQTEMSDIGAMALDVASRFQNQAALNSFTLRVNIADSLPRIRVDKEALSRALFNLLDNAVKYSGKNPHVILSAWSDGHNIFFDVEDNGIGIRKSEQQKIFDKFFRSERALEGHIKGSGIGLTVVDHIVKAHGGNVLIESEEEKGTKVTIRLPIGVIHNDRSGDG